MTTRKLAYAVGVAIGFLAFAAVLKFAQRAGVIEADTATRGVQALIGLGLAIYANFMPKQIGAGRASAIAEMRTQAALRVGGWSFALAGLIYAGLWAFAPLSVADVLGGAVIAGAMVLTLAYAIWAYLACRRPADLAH